MDAALKLPLALRVSSGAQAATSSRPAPPLGRSSGCRRGSRLPARASHRPDDAQQAAWRPDTRRVAPQTGAGRGFQTFTTPAGRVLVTSKGCRPVSDKEFAAMIDDPQILASKAAVQRYESALLDASSDANANFPCLFAHFVGAMFQGERLVERVYEEALQAHPNDPALLCSYADYLVYQSNDPGRASKLYQRAVEVDTSPTALATFAHFLFRNPCQDTDGQEDELWDLSSVQSFLDSNSPAGSTPQL